MRWIVAYLDPERLARRCWRATDEEISAAVGVDLATGSLKPLTWAAGEPPPTIEGFLVYCYRAPEVYFW